jgi:hypothetical protein
MPAHSSKIVQNASLIAISVFRGDYDIIVAGLMRGVKPGLKAGFLSF